MVLELGFLTCTADLHVGTITIGDRIVFTFDPSSPWPLCATSDIFPWEDTENVRVQILRLIGVEATVDPGSFALFHLPRKRPETSEQRDV